MESEIKKFGENEHNLNCFKLQYEGQNIEKTQEFQKWYNETNIKIKKENIESKREYLKQDYMETELLLISFCPYCCSYSVCAYEDGFCFITCKNCHTKFCIECYYKYLNDNDIASACPKAYLKLFYLRIIYKRSELCVGNYLFYIIHILVCLFLTPLILGIISNMIGLSCHKKKTKRNRINENNENEENNNDNSFDEDKLRIKVFIIIIYSFFRGLLMFPYEIIFFPFMVILLLPGIFSRKYYLTIFVMYITSLMPGGGYLENDIVEE